MLLEYTEAEMERRAKNASGIAAHYRRQARKLAKHGSRCCRGADRRLRGIFEERTSDMKCQYRIPRARRGRAYNTKCQRDAGNWYVLIPGRKRAIRTCQLHVWHLFDLYGADLKAEYDSMFGRVAFDFELADGKPQTVAGLMRSLKRDLARAGLASVPLAGKDRFGK